MSCLSCQSTQHVVFSCPYITFQPNLQHLLRRYHFSRDQEQYENFKRKNKVYYCALKDRYLLLEGFQRYFFDHDEKYGNVDILPMLDFPMMDKQIFRKNLKAKTIAGNAKMDDEKRVILKQKIL